MLSMINAKAVAVFGVALMFGSLAQLIAGLATFPSTPASISPVTPDISTKTDTCAS
jgi:hypothetical protein